MEQQDFFFEQEVSFNRFMAIANIVVAVSLLIEFIIHRIHFFNVYERNFFPIEIFFVVMLITILNSFIAMYYKCSKKWIKYLLMFSLLFATVFAYALFSYAASIVMAIPVIVSSRYYSARFTITVGIVTLVLFFVASISFAFYGMIDLNNMEFPKHTTISLGEETSLFDYYYKVGFHFDRRETLENILIYDYLTNVVQFIIIGAFGVIATLRQREFINKQREHFKQETKARAEMSTAANIQTGRLPNDFSIFTDNKNVDLYATMNAARSVGGDFYDFYFIDKNHLYIAIADVSGKGVPAALFMMISKYILLSNAKMGLSPAKILEEANETLCLNNKEEMFVTAWIGILELSTGKLVAANAGHERPVTIQADGNCTLIKDPHGFVLGSFKGMKYENYELMLKPQEKLFVYTDGVTDEKNPAGKMYGRERMLNTLGQVKGLNPRQVLDKVRNDLADYMQKEEQFDDITMLCIEYKG